MKRLIHNTTAIREEIYIKKIVSIVLVDDVSELDNYYPRDYAVYGSTMNYNELTSEQLSQLPRKELDKITDIRTLRKLPKSLLNYNQQYLMTQENNENFESTIKEVKNALSKLKDCGAVYIQPGSIKNNTFRDKLKALGCRLTDDDVYEIVGQLHVKDYSYSTISYLDRNWNALLMVFEYKGSHTFKPFRKSNAEPVTLEGMDVYIKIDVDNETEEGYAVMSFHDPEFKLSHPYADYPVDKE